MNDTYWTSLAVTLATAAVVANSIFDIQARRILHDRILVLEQANIPTPPKTPKIDISTLEDVTGPAKQVNDRIWQMILENAETSLNSKIAKE